MLDTIMKVCGCFFVLSVTAMLFTIIGTLIANKRKLKKETLEAKALEEASISIGRKLVSSSHYLKEKEAMLVCLIGRSLLQFGTFDIVKIKEELDNESL